MKAMILGGDSCIGKALAFELAKTEIRAICTSRRRQSLHPIFCDLSDQIFIPKFPACDVAFLCAGIKGFKECDQNPMSWRVNVDGILAAGKQLIRSQVFVVYVSTDAIEWSDVSYARQRAHVEMGLQAFGDPAIVRCCRFDDATAPRAATFMIEIAQNRQAGIHHWSATTDAKRMAA